MYNKNHDKRFTTALKMMFSTEGGYNNLKNDYGGPTNLGITQTTFNRWRTKKNKAIEDIRNITKDEAEKIYYEMYWKASGADKQKDIRDAYILFDTAVQYGDVTAKRMFKQSGNDFYKMIDARREQYKKTVEVNPTQKTFLEGWLNRINNLEKQGEHLAKEERLSSLYSENVNPNMDNTIREYMNFNKIDDNDKLNNKIHYYMQKNQEALDKHDYTKQSKTTGFAANVSDMDFDINNEDLRKKVFFANEDVGKMTTKEFSEIEDIVNRQLQDGMMLGKDYFENKVTSGDMVWVDEYVRGDGTKVSGHYRSK